MEGDFITRLAYALRRARYAAPSQIQPPKTKGFDVSELKRSINEAVRAIRKASKAKPKIGIVLGTGLGGLADRMKVTARISYDDIPHFP